MKKPLLLFAAATIALAASAQRYTVQGKALSGASHVYLSPLGEKGADSVATTADGRFTFTGDAQGKHLAYLYTKGEKAVYLAVFLEGEIYADMEALTVAGSEENRGLDDYQQFARETRKPLIEVSRRLTAKQESGQNITEHDLAEYYDLADTVTAAMTARAKKDLFYNSRMRWPAFIVQDLLNDFDKDYLVSLDNPDNAFMAEPCLEKARTLAAAYRRTQTGQKFADFEMPDTAGTVHKLSEYVGRGSYVLLDFWATWCGPCMHELPNVKALYDKYHAKGFNIVGISFDQDGDSWRAVIRRKEMNWTHLSDLGGWKSLPVEFYGVRAIPHMMLIAPDGTIIANDINSERLAEKLAEIYD
ncbi:MAG: AhpC/TSA family protein [Bacteroidaceae bacterium]|nr:AhpC/TSA family protein [Bacteroidaceae bacterium]